MGAPATDSPQKLGAFRIPADAACLDGHFPGNPLVPGVVLLDLALALVATHLGTPDARPASVQTAKFLSPVLPDEIVDVQLLAATPSRISFACRVGDRLVLSGVAGFAAPGFAAPELAAK